MHNPIEYRPIVATREDTMTTPTYTFISDPGHGWLRVPLAHLIKSGYRPTEFSYFDHCYAFLEEDCDAPLFMKAAGITQDNIRHYDTHHFNRDNKHHFPGKPQDVTMAEMEALYKDD